MGRTAENIARITLAGLKESGWTDGAVKQFLGEPDALVSNPNYGSGPRMRLYDLLRVVRTEQSQAWRVWRDRTKARREKGSVGQAERMSASRAFLAARINAVEISIPRLLQEKLFLVAVDSRNAQAQWHAVERDRFDHAHTTVASADAAALQRWAVNYLRHVETDYDSLPDSAAGRVGVVKARLIIRERVLDAIPAQYPFLAAECAHQKAQRQ